MKRPLHNTTSLPRQLRDELGINNSHANKKRKHSGPVSRKERRQADRKRGPVSKVQNTSVSDDDDDDLGGSESDAGDVMNKLAQLKKSKSTGAKGADKKVTSAKVPSLDLQESDDEEGEEELEEEEDSEDDGDDDDMQPRKMSKTVQHGLAQDDAEIAALEKKLGLKKGKKLPSSFAEDGLGYLLGDLDGGSDNEARKQKTEMDEWLSNKRKKAPGLLQAGGDDDEIDEDDQDSEDGSENDDDDEDDDFEGFDEEEKTKKKPRSKEKENPYTAPVSKPVEQAPRKYIPPSLRGISNSESESLTRLRRQAQGQLNKLSESNLVSILSEIEKLYREYPRQNVTSVLISLLLGLICERSALQDTFIILHAGFIAAMYKTVGMDFGAELVQNIVQRLDASGDDRGKFEGKQSVNLISLLSQLYNFQVVGSALVFDYIRIFLQDITEENTELLLKIIKSEYFHISKCSLFFFFFFLL